MKYLHKKIGGLFTACALVLSVVVPCLASAATQHYYIRPLRTGDTIYYDNSISEWSTVKIYIFSLAEQTHPFEWNERPDMTYVDNNIWKYTVTAGSNIEGHDYDYVIFTNGKSGSNSRQTVDIGFVGNGYAYKSDSWEGSKRSGYWYLYDVSAVTLEHVTALKTGDVIYFDNSGTNWDGVNVYMYNPNNTGSGSGPFAWNGTAMTHVSGGIYEYPVPADINIESYNDTHVVFSNTAGSSQTIDLGFIKSGYAYKVESWENNKGIGYWYVYNKTPLIEAINEVSTYLNKLACLAPSEYAAATQAIADGNRALNSEIPLETDAPSEPGAYWNQVDVEIANLQTKLSALKQEYGDVPTVCTFSPELTKVILDPQTYYRFGDAVSFRVDITNSADFAVSATITDQMAGTKFTTSTTGDYVVVSDQVAETRPIAAGETLSLYVTYPVTTDITRLNTNTVEITSATAAATGYYLSDGDHTASISFNTQSWEDVPVPTGIDSNKDMFVILFIGGAVAISINIMLQYRRKSG